MFILILILNLFAQPVYAQDITNVPTLPISTTITQVPTVVPVTVQPVTPIQTITSAPTDDPTVVPTIADTPVPTDTIAPTSIPTPTTNPIITGGTTITPTSTVETINGATVTPSPWPTEVVTASPTWTPFPAKPANYQDPPIPPIIPGVIKGVGETFAPDVAFPKSFLQFEKDGENVYASTQMSPSQTRGLLLVSLFLIIGGLGLISYRKALALIPKRQIVDTPDLSYAVSEVGN